MVAREQLEDRFLLGGVELESRRSAVVDEGVNQLVGLGACRREVVE